MNITQFPSAATDDGGDVPLTHLSDVDPRELYEELEDHQRRVAEIAKWAVIGSIDTPLCRRCCGDLYMFVDESLWKVIDRAALGDLNSADDLHAAKLRVSGAMMDAVWDEHRNLEGRWRTEGVRKRYDPPTMPQPIPFGGWRAEPDCAEPVPCYMRVQVSK